MTAATKSYVPRLRKAYAEKIVKDLLAKLKLANVHQAPKLEKIVVNMGVSEAKDNIQALDLAKAELASITGQAPVVCRAKKSISNFKLRQGMPIGVRVTLRGTRMWDFLDRLMAVALPRIRDFQGLDLKKGFDGQGNWNLGIKEQTLFVEVNPEKATGAPRGMNISIITTATNDEQARELLKALGMPFKKDAKKEND